MDNPIVKAYLEFLTNYKINQDNTLKPEHLITFENMRKSIEIAEFHIENVKPKFAINCGNESLNKNSNWDLLKDNNRTCNYKLNIFHSETGNGSNILHSFSLVEMKLIAQICIKPGH
jgi:hypothetical protein